MQLYCFLSLHVSCVLFVDFSVMFFRRNAILCLQVLSLMQAPSRLNNQNQMKYLQINIQLIVILQMSHPPNH